MRLFAILAVSVLAGCASVSDSSMNPLNWFGSTSPSAKMAELTEIKASVTLRTVWRASVGNAGKAIFSPAIATGKGDVIAFSGEGVLLWKSRVTSEVLAAPVVSGDLVIVRSADSRIYGLNAKDGKRRWVYQRATPALSVRSPAGVAAMRGNAYAGFAGGKMVAIALSNGGVRWESTVALPKGATEIERVTDVVGLPLVSEREACAVAYQGRVACIDANNGTVLWSRDMSSTSGLGWDARTIYVSDDKGGVHALDRASGNSLWKQDKLFLRNLSAPIGLGSAVAVADVQGYVHLLARDSGAFVGRMATDGSPISTNPLILDGGFLVQTRNGGVFSIAATN